MSPFPFSSLLPFRSFPPRFVSLSLSVRRPVHPVWSCSLHGAFRGDLHSISLRRAASVCHWLSHLSLSLTHTYIQARAQTHTFSPSFFPRFFHQPSSFPSFPLDIARSFSRRLVVALSLSFFLPSPRVCLSPARGLPPPLRPDVFSSLCPCILPRRESAASSAGHTPVAP